MRIIRTIVIAVLGLVVSLRLVFSYIDPNTGGLVFQLLAVILASLTGILYFFSRQIRMTIGRTKRMLRNSSGEMADTEDDEDLRSPGETTDTGA